MTVKLKWQGFGEELNLQVRHLRSLPEERHGKERAFRDETKGTRAEIHRLNRESLDLLKEIRAYNRQLYDRTTMKGLSVEEKEKRKKSIMMRISKAEVRHSRLLAKKKILQEKLRPLRQEILKGRPTIVLNDQKPGLIEVLSKSSFSGAICFPSTQTYDVFVENQTLEPQPIRGIVNVFGDGKYTENESWLKLLTSLVGDKPLMVYRGDLYECPNSASYSQEELALLVKELHFKREKRFTRIQKKLRLYNKLERFEDLREPIPEDVRMFVWRRDRGRCTKCGSQENLEFDHIIPVSRGGSNTERNIQLLCEKCNREKAANI